MLAVDGNMTVYDPQLVMLSQLVSNVKHSHVFMKVIRVLRGLNAELVKLYTSLRSIRASWTLCWVVLTAVKCYPATSISHHGLTTRHPTSMFESVSADYFHISGKTHLVYVDHLSGWPCIVSCPGTALADHLVCQLWHIYRITGVPNVLGTDRKPRFSSSTLCRFLEHWEVHCKISPIYAKANGHAEVAVK